MYKLFSNLTGNAFDFTPDLFCMPFYEDLP
jgi:hypothetical protein